MLARLGDDSSDQRDGGGAAPHWMPQQAPTSGLAVDPALLMLPYTEFSRAMLRAHHNVHAMVEANRALNDAMREILRRQMDLALEIAEQAWAGSVKEDGATRGEAVFERAADAVREIGSAMIQAQLDALETLRGRTGEAEAAVGGAPLRKRSSST